jgi:Family of unknown function (DUF6152)
MEMIWQCGGDFMKRFCIGLLAAGLLASPGGAFAHHSFAIFDQTKTETLTGTVKNFQWTNPHVYLDIVVDDGKNPPTLWPLEGSSVVALYRNGWKKSMLKEGDKVTVKIHPLRSGKPGGNVLTVTLPSGEEMKACCS